MYQWDIFAEVIDAIEFIEKGGPGSGHHGHAGRKGRRGGSAPRSVAGKFYSNRDAARSFTNAFNKELRPIGGKVSIARQDPKAKNTTSVYLRTATGRDYWGKHLNSVQEILEGIGFKKFSDPSQKKTTRSFRAGDIVVHARKVKETGRHYIRTDFIDKSK